MVRLSIVLTHSLDQQFQRFQTISSMVFTVGRPSHQLRDLKQELVTCSKLQNEDRNKAAL
jgi:hypothetical protein